MKKMLKQTNGHSANGWTAERRARQARLIQRWKPWRGATGPRTPAGRAKSAHNAFKHGNHSNVAISDEKRRATGLRAAVYVLDVLDERRYVRGQRKLLSLDHALSLIRDERSASSSPEEAAISYMFKLLNEKTR